MYQANKKSAAAGGPTSTRARLTCPNNCGRSRTAREFAKVCRSVSCRSVSEGERQRGRHGEMAGGKDSGRERGWEDGREVRWSVCE